MTRRCHLVHGDFFAMVADERTFADDAPDLVHAVLVDIDHTPRHLLHPSHGAFYTADGLRRLADRLHPGGVFALWSDAPPDDAFLTTLAAVFADLTAEVVTFPNHHTGRDAANTIYLATRPLPSDLLLRAEGVPQAQLAMGPVQRRRRPLGQHRGRVAADEAADRPVVVREHRPDARPDQDADRRPGEPRHQREGHPEEAELVGVAEDEVRHPDGGRDRVARHGDAGDDAPSAGARASARCRGAGTRP